MLAAAASGQRRAAATGLRRSRRRSAPRGRPGGPPNRRRRRHTRSERRLTIADLPAPRRFVTRHETTIRGQRLRYTATAGETYITSLFGEPTASIFSFAYVKDGPRDPNRPVLFVFNGGPGSASVWLHMGVVGPGAWYWTRRSIPATRRPSGSQDNPYSPLDVADLVFIDPVGTGFSHAVGNARNADFFGVDEDADSVARFIELWLTENGRWNSPKYLMGESYGATRAAILPRALIGGPFYTGVMRGITVNGIVLVSAWPWQWTGLRSRPSRPGPTGRPLLAEHRRRPPGITIGSTGRAGRAAQVYEEASQFATTDYANALLPARAAEPCREAEKARIARQPGRL